jgi:hypothetical protein
VRQSGDLEPCVARAEAHVQAALRLWRADQPSRCAECCLSLGTAIRELESVQRDQERGVAFPVAPLAKRLKKLQADINRLTRLVDSAAAFCRGMALTIGRDGDASAASGPDALPRIEGVA